MRFYCSDHGKDVYVPHLPGRVECYTESNIERHYLGAFPSNNFWEYCCDCDTAWRAGSRGAHQPSVECPRCKSLFSFRYLCDQCGVFTLDSKSAFSDRSYRLGEQHLPIKCHNGLSEIACPGCSNPPLSDMGTHACRVGSIQYWTARAECPLCEEQIDDEPTFPSLGAECLRKIPNDKRLLVAFDIVQNTFINTPDGKLLVLANGTANAVLIPTITRFESDEVYAVYYSGSYDCNRPTTGDVRILSPAIVDRSGDGWRLSERGRLEVIGTQLKRDVTTAGMNQPGPITSFATAAATQLAAAISSQGPHEGISRAATPRVAPAERCRSCNRRVEKDAIHCGNCGAVIIDVSHLAISTTSSPSSGRSPETTLDEEPLALPELRMVSTPLVATDESPILTRSTKQPQRKTKSFVLGVAILTLGFLLLVIIPWKLFSSLRSNPPKNELMVRVEAGNFLMGSNDREENERPQHKVMVKPLSIDTYEVSRADYEKFIHATNHRAPSGWSSGGYPPNTGKWPVTGVDWYDAAAYCKWMGKRLPSEEEWEFAARGLDGRKYPWGNEWKSGFANAENASQGLTDIDRFKGASPYGAIGMAGNAWEWTATKLVAYPGGRIPPQELGDGTVDLRVIRGGSWQSDRSSATTTYRWGWPASGGKDYSNTGFRCVMDAQ